METSPVGLSPSFESTRYEYSAEVAESVDAVSIVFTLSDNATARVLGREKGMINLTPIGAVRMSLFANLCLKAESHKESVQAQYRDCFRHSWIPKKGYCVRY